MMGQGLRSNPKGLALRDQTGRHILLRPVGKVGVVLVTGAFLRKTLNEKNQKKDNRYLCLLWRGMQNNF
jgi:hypothetical protein